VTISECGNNLFSISAGGQAKHWNVSTGECGMTFVKNDTPVTYVLPISHINMVVVLYNDGELGL